MMDKRSWEEFFDDHATQYMENTFVQHTEEEATFIIENLSPPAGGKILDVGCGTGRHSIELARRGYQMTGVDISSGMLEVAAQAAEKAGVDVNWVKADATHLELDDTFDIALSLCEGGISLIGMTDHPIEHDLAILENIYAMLKPGGRVMVTAINGMRFLRKYNQSDIDKGVFNPINMTQYITMDLDLPGGKKSITARERGYVPTELRLLFRMAGYEVEHIGGGTAGKWGIRQPELDEIELMVIGRKPEA